MYNKWRIGVFVCLLSIIFIGCTAADTEKGTMTEKTIQALIIGSAEHPDPILEMVDALEKQGLLTDVIVRESFPVQIQVTGPESIIKRLQSTPKKTSPSFK